MQPRKPEPPKASRTTARTPKPATKPTPSATNTTATEHDKQPASHDSDKESATTERGHVRTPAKRGRKKGGKNRPKPPRSASEQLAEDRAAVILRQRSDCKRLADAINACARQGDKGAGSSGLAAAVGQLSRATATLHDLETKAYGLQGDNRGQVAVIMVPAQALTIQEWAQGVQAAGLQTIGGPSPDDPHARASGQAPRLIEPDVDGEAPADGPDGHQTGADGWDDL